MSDPTDVFETSAFKQSGDGYILRVPNFWMIGRARYYLATEAQKNEIVARVKAGRRRSLVLAGLLWLVVFVAFVTGLALLTDRDQPGVSEVVAMIVFAILSLVLFLHFWYVLLLRPSLRSLAVTDQRFSFADRRAAMRAAMRGKSPSGQFLFVGVLLSLSCCFSLYSFLLVTHGGHFSSQGGSGFASLFAAIATGLSAAIFFYREVSSSRSGGDAAEGKTAEVNAEPLEARLARLQSDHAQLRRNMTKAAACIAVAVVGAIILNGTVRNVDADRLILRNATGETAALLSVGSNGAATLGLYGPDHTANLILGVSTSGAPSLGLYGPDRKLRTVLGLTSAGAPVLRLNGPKEEGRLSLTLADDGSPDLQLTGADGKSRLALTAHASNPGVILSDASGAIKLRLAVDSTGVPIRIFNASATPIKVFDADGKELTAPK